MNEKPQPIIWERGTNDLEYFGSLSFDDLLSVLEDENTARYYAGTVLYAQECKKYRPDPTGKNPEGLPVRSETKIMFLIGSTRDSMWLCKDFEGKPIRTKKKDGRSEGETDNLQSDLLYKASEKIEIFGTLSKFIDGDRNTSASDAFSEVVDAFYNLHHLKITDPDKAEWYEAWIRNLAKPLGLKTTEVIQLLAAKYHPRMFKNNGQNNFEEEDLAIHDLLENFYGDNLRDDKKEIKQRLSRFLNMLNVLFNIGLPRRFKDLQFEYNRAEKPQGTFLDTMKNLLLGNGKVRRMVEKHVPNLTTEIEEAEKMNDNEISELLGTLAEILYHVDISNETSRKK